MGGLDCTHPLRLLGIVELLTFDDLYDEIRTGIVEFASHQELAEPILFQWVYIQMLPDQANSIYATHSKHTTGMAPHPNRRVFRLHEHEATNIHSRTYEPKHLHAYTRSMCIVRTCINHKSIDPNMYTGTTSMISVWL